MTLTFCILSGDLVAIVTTSKVYGMTKVHIKLFFFLINSIFGFLGTLLFSYSVDEKRSISSAKAGYSNYFLIYSAEISLSPNETKLISTIITNFLTMITTSQ